MKPTKRSPQIVDVPVPDGLSEGASKVWKRIVPVLVESGRWESIDTFAVEMLCEAYAQYMAAKQSIASEGLLMVVKSEVRDPAGNVTKRGRVSAHPLIPAMRELAETVRSLCRELGMTPSARRLLQGVDRSADKPVAEMTAEELDAAIEAENAKIALLPLGARRDRVKRFERTSRKTGGEAPLPTPSPAGSVYDLGDSEEMSPEEAEEAVEDVVEDAGGNDDDA